MSETLHQFRDEMDVSTEPDLKKIKENHWLHENLVARGGSETETLGDVGDPRTGNNVWLMDHLARRISLITENAL